MEENEREEGGLSLSDILRIIFSQKWLALIILIIVTAAAAFGIYFLKGVMSMHYDVSFTFNLPEAEEGGSSSKASASPSSYPDGTPFYFTDMVSLKTLKSVQERNPRFRDIDIEGMSNSDDISITREILEPVGSFGEYEAVYTISVKATYFKDRDVAKEFLQTLAEIPIDYLNTMDINYFVYVSKYDGEGAYESFSSGFSDYISEIDRLISQNEYLKERYETYNKLYNDLSLISCKADIENNIDGLLTLRSQISTCGYFKTLPDKDFLNIELDKLKRRLDTEKYILESLTSSSADAESTAYPSQIMEQAAIVANLIQRIADIENVLSMEEFIYGDDVPKEVIAALEKAYYNCVSSTEEFKKVTLGLYNKVATVSYFNSNKIVTSGTIGIFETLAISFISGLTLAVLIAFTVGWKKQNKPVKKARSAVKKGSVPQDNTCGDEVPETA